MAEFVLYRRTKLSAFFEVVIADDDPRPADDPTARTTNLVRAFSRGDFAVLEGEIIDVVVTRLKTTNRRVLGAARISDTHLDVDISAFNQTMTWPLGRGWNFNFDVYIGPARGQTLPPNNMRMDDYLAQAPYVP